MRRLLVVSAVALAALTGCSSQGGTPMAKPSTFGSYVKNGVTYTQGQTDGLPAGPGVDIAGAMGEGMGCMTYDEAAQKRCVAGTIARHVDLPKCQTEDDDSDCYWDAWSMGNRTGHSFVVWDGRLYDLVDGTNREVK